MKNHPGYELVSAVGRGRLATVYRARDRSLKREVAVKELTDEARRDQRQLDRFWDEARFLAKLEHDNVVQIYGLDQERGWIIMELMAGSLDAVVASRPLAPDVVRGILHQVLDGLDCLHQKKRVHGAVALAERHGAEALVWLDESLHTEWQRDLEGKQQLFALLAAAHLEQRHAVDAERWARVALAETPERIGPHYFLAGALELEGRPRDAAVEYRAILALAPGHPPARDALRRLGATP